MRLLLISSQAKTHWSALGMFHRAAQLCGGPGSPSEVSACTDETQVDAGWPCAGEETFALGF